MKAFLLSALVLTLASGASAQSLKEATLTKSPVINEEAGETWKDLGEGTYSDFIISNIAHGYFNDPVPVQIQESEQTPGRYRVLNPWPTVTESPELNYLIVDASDPDFVMIPEQKSPVDDPSRGKTNFCTSTYYMTNMVGMSKDVLKEGGYAWIPKLKDGKIDFTTTSLAVLWTEYTGDEVQPGQWTFANMEYTGYLKLPGSQAQDDWNSIGTGRMLDGAVWPAFDVENPPVEKDVEIYESNSKPGTYRIAGAFTDISPETARDLIIDASDPNFCRIRKQNVGILTRDYGWTYVFSVSMNGNFMDYDDMVSQYPEWANRNITLDENGFFIPRTSILLYFPDYDGVNAVVVSNSIDSYILFPGKGGISGIEKDEPAETLYYNLQGQRVRNPQSGQIVIVRRGSESFKTIAR